MKAHFQNSKFLLIFSKDSTVQTALAMTGAHALPVPTATKSALRMSPSAHSAIQRSSVRISMQPW